MPTIDPKHVSDDVRALNPQLFGKEEAAQAAPPSPLEEKFLRMWHERLLERDFPLESEYRFHPIRKWRFDFAHPGTKVAVELEGGLYMQGRHNQAQGYIDDLEKYNTAASMGWAVFRFAGVQITEENLYMVVNAIKVRGLHLAMMREVLHAEGTTADSDGRVAHDGGPQADITGVPRHLPILREPDT